MKLQKFEVESYMTLHENTCTYNLADTCAKPLTLEELLHYESDDILSQLKNLSLDYGAIEGTSELKQGILTMYESGDEDEIAITHGGINANELVLMTLLNPGDHIICLYPTYQQLYSFPESLGIYVDCVYLKEENNWEIDLDEMISMIGEHTKMICLNLPNNPTGTTLTKAQFEKLAKACKPYNTYILVDEIYRGIYDHEPAISDIYEWGISTSGLSKVLSTAGLRIGWIKTQDKALIKLINERRDYHIISSGTINDYLGTIVLKHKEEIIARNKAIVEENKAFLKEWLKSHPQISCIIPEFGTVCFLKYKMDMKSVDLAEKLQEDTGVFFVPGMCFGIENHLRFGLANDCEVVRKGFALFDQWLTQF